MTDSVRDYFAEVQKRFGREWFAIASARSRTIEALDRLSALREFESRSTSIVMFGSIGRAEVTSGSDADWTLLIDGPSDPEHYRLALRIGRQISELGFDQPGPTGTFGDLVSSHNLVHYIAGTRDSNENLTRRILLLSESRSITSPLVREAVIRNVLNRYVVYDRTVPRPDAPRTIVPHFLLNDVVRYWRTIAADYASKMWERDAKEWAIRNVKLRFSRKLLFAWGLAACFAFQVFPPDDRDELIADRENFPSLFAEFILHQTGFTPLDQICRLLLRRDSPEIADSILDGYDMFLAALDDAETRKHLDGLEFEAAAADRTYQQLRLAGHRFGEGLLQLFYDDPVIGKLIRRFGLF